MKLRSEYILFVNIALILGIVGLIGLEMHMLTRAQPADSEVGFELDESGRCVTFLKQFMVGKQVEFGEFMNQHFRSPKPTSELIEVAVERYRQYRKEVRAEMIRLSGPVGGKTVTAVASERTACEEVMNEDFTIMMELIKQHISGNAYAKKSTRLLDKYKEINGKLEKLNFTIAQMYGYFGALSQKLPCYATKCLKR